MASVGNNISIDIDDLDQPEYHYCKARKLGLNGIERRILLGNISTYEIERLKKKLKKVVDKICKICYNKEVS